MRSLPAATSWSPDRPIWGQKDAAVALRQHLINNFEDLGRELGVVVDALAPLVVDEVGMLLAVLEPVARALTPHYLPECGSTEGYSTVSGGADRKGP